MMTRADRHERGLTPFATLWLLVVGLIAAGCGGAPAAPDRGALDPEVTWQWQLQGEINTSYDVDVYDIDLFETPQSVIDELRASGRTVICYFSAGSVEDWRDDADAFPAAVVGEPLDGWPGESWLDIRESEVRAVQAARLDVAVARGCDGVEPDNVNAFEEVSGFDLDAADQLDFNLFLAAQARDRNLLIGLKNDLDQIPQLVDAFDFAVNEQCLQFEECDAYEPFVEAGKPVLGAEYDPLAVDDSESTCRAAAEFGLRTLILPVLLDDSFRISC